LAGRSLMVGLPGPSLDRDTALRLRELGPGGLIFFGRNLVSPEQLADLVGELDGLLPHPLLLAMDQEGGKVSRLEPWIGPTQPAGQLGRLGTAAVARAGTLTAEALRALGLNVDFAPVVDLCSAGVANGIGDRSFGTDPRRVVELAGSFADSLQEAGVMACLKHFPGLGCTRVDSHLELPLAEREPDALHAEELLPYRELCPRVAAVMVGHGHYPAWNPGSPLPASGSAEIVTGVLRREIGFDGLVTTDDLEMGAVGNLDAAGAFGVQALRAGCDLLLYCADLDRAETARNAIAADADLEPRLRDAAAAVHRTALRWPAPRPDLDAWERAADALRQPGTRS